MRNVQHYFSYFCFIVLLPFLASIACAYFRLHIHGSLIPLFNIPPIIPPIFSFIEIAFSCLSIPLSNFTFPFSFLLFTVFLRRLFPSQQSFPLFTSRIISSSRYIFSPLEIYLHPAFYSPFKLYSTILV